MSDKPRFADRVKIPRPWIPAKDHAGVDGLKAFEQRLAEYRKQATKGRGNVATIRLPVAPNAKR